VLAQQPGERLLGNVLRVIRAEQGGQPYHLRVPGPEQRGHGGVIGSVQRWTPDVEAGVQVCHAPKTPFQVKG
jgi:hypothetical protein